MTTNEALEAVAPLIERVRQSPYIPHEPTAKQWAFLLAPETEVGYGGAAGGGKSDALLMAALIYADQPEYSALLLRTSYAELKQEGALIPRSRKWLGPTDAEYNRQDKAWSFPSGATVAFGYLDAEGDERQYQSAHFHFIGFDEATQFSENHYRFLFSRLRRGEGSDIPLRMRSATNPTGPGLRWYRQRFIEGEHDDRRFIPARLEDNPHLSTEEYEKQLERLPPELARKLREGSDWSELGGGTIFDKDGPEVVDAPPATIRKEVRFWDFAATPPSGENPDPDYLCGVKLAECADGSFGIRHVRRERLPPNDVETVIRSVAEKDGQDVPVILEVEGGSQSKISVQYIARRVLTGFNVHTERVTRGKEDRASPFASQWRNGNVWLERGKWLQPYLDELHAFPHGDYDDQVDASSGAFNWLGTHQKPGRSKKDDAPQIAHQPSPF